MSDVAPRVARSFWPLLPKPQPLELVVIFVTFAAAAVMVLTVLVTDRPRITDLHSCMRHLVETRQATSWAQDACREAFP